jgi:chromosome segregation ATPase
MGKRVGTKSAEPAAKVQRAEKSVESAKASPKEGVSDPLLEACEPLFKALKGGVYGPQGLISVEEAEAEMLCAAMPHALRVPEHGGQRHEFQERVLDTLAKHLSDVVTSRRQALQLVEKEVADLEALKEQSGAALESIAMRLAVKVQERNDADMVLQKQKDVLKDANAALDAAKVRQDGAEEERRALDKDIEEHVTGLTELWSPLKTSEWEGKHWRTRNKILARLVEMLEKIGVEPSLLAALPVALKIKADARGKFAQATVASAEEAYTKHIDHLKKRVDNFAEEITTRAATVAQCETSVKSAQAELDTAMEGSTNAQNAWVEETRVQSETKAKIDNYGPATTALEQKLKETQDEIANLVEVSNKFAALRTSGSIVQELPASSVGEDAVAAAKLAETAA